MYTDHETASWEDSVGYQVRQQLLELSLDGPEVVIPLRDRVVIHMRFNLDRPKSAKSDFPITSREDVDNLGKAALDALQNAGLLSNDNRVTDLSVVKRYAGDGHPRGVEIDVTGWNAASEH